MEQKTFYTKTRRADAHFIGNTGYHVKQLVVSVHSLKTGKNLTVYRLPLDLSNEVSKINSYSALVAFAKANQITDSASNAHCGSDSASVTSCPVPAPAPAKSAAKGQGILFVEVETNGRGKDTEVIEIAIVSEDETVLFHTFVKPSKPMKKDGLTVDDIHHSDLLDAPTLDRIWSAFAAVIGRSPIAFYNAEYCKKMIIKSLSKAFDAQVPNNFASLFPYNKVLSVSERYQHFNNYSSGYFQNNRSQYLNQACGQQGIIWRDLPNNRAASSAIKCARLHKLLNDKELPA